LNPAFYVMYLTVDQYFTLIAFQFTFCSYKELEPYYNKKKLLLPNNKIKSRDPSYLSAILFLHPLLKNLEHSLNVSEANFHQGFLEAGDYGKRFKSAKFYFPTYFNAVPGCSRLGD